MRFFDLRRIEKGVSIDYIVEGCEMSGVCVQFLLVDVEFIHYHL